MTDWNCGLKDLEQITVMDFYNTKSETIAYQYVYKEKIAFEEGEKLTVSDHYGTAEYVVLNKKSFLETDVESKNPLGMKDLFDREINDIHTKHILWTNYKLMKVDAE